MGHLLERRIVVAFICLSISSSVPASRNEDLERAAELAVERAAERAAERAVEKSLEAGNKTSMTITVKESYSNARKTAEEQAAPGSESTRYNDGKTSVFESKDLPDNPDYEVNEQEYTDDNDTRSPNDYDDSRGHDYNESRGYNDYNDSRGVDDYEADYDEPNDPKNMNQSTSPNQLAENEPKSVNDYEDRGEEAEEDYTVPSDTDYQKLNKSKPKSDPEIPEAFGDFDSDFRNEFGSKLTNAGGKLADESLEDDVKFYPNEDDFLKKKDAKKIAKVEEEKEDEEPEYKDEDTWKSYSDWHKDFKSIGEESFPNGSFWDDDDDSLKIWSEDDETSEKKPTASTDKKSSSATLADKSPTNFSPKDFDFKGWQSDDVNDDDDEDDDLDDSVPAADGINEKDATRGKNDNSYRRRSSRDDYFYRDGPVYRGQDEKNDGDNDEKNDGENDEQNDEENYEASDDATTTERIEATSSRSPAARFRNTFRERSRAQYQKIMQARYSDSGRRLPYSYGGNRFQNFTERRNITDGAKRFEYRPYRPRYTDDNDSTSSGIYNPFKDLTTYRVYPKALDDKMMITKSPVLSMNRSSLISPPMNPPIGLNPFGENLPENVHRNIQEDLQANIQSSLQDDLQKNLQSNLQSNLKRNLQSNLQSNLQNNLQNDAQSNQQKNIHSSPQGTPPKIPRRPSFVQLPPQMPKLENIEEDMPPIPSTMLTVPKTRPNEKVKMMKPHPYDVITSQRPQRIPMRKHQKFVPDSQIPLFVNTALPGPFHVTKQQTIVHDNRPFTIHLDKSIPIALRKRRPFIVHLPLKPYEQSIRPENRRGTVVENDSAVSENRLRKFRFSLASQ